MGISIWTLAVTPGIILAVIIYLVDRYDREPLPLLFKIFMLGAFSVFPVIIVENILLSLNVFSGALSGLYVSFIVAGFTEEYFKRLVVLKWAFNDTHFNEKLDGIVFSVFSALGFATIENISYVVFRYSNVYVGFLRGILSVPAHMLFAITMGYYLSLVKYCKNCGYEDKQNYLKKSLYVPMILHGTFNFILMLGFERYLMLFLVYVGYLWTVNIKRLKEYARESRVQHREDGDEY